MKIVVVELFGAGQHIVRMIFGDQPVRLVGAAAEGVHHVGDLLAVAMIRPGDRIVMGDGDQPRPKVDEGEHHALGQKRDG